MSVPTHRAPSARRPRRWRAASAVIATATLTLVTAGVAMADSVTLESDSLKVSTNVQYGPTSNPANHACSERGNAVAGSIDIAYDNSGGSVKHFTAGEDLNVEVTNGTPGITVDTPANPSILGDWGNGSTSQSLALSTTVSTSVPAGNHPITITVTGDQSGVVRDDTYSVNVDSSCPVTSANTAPVVEFSTPPTSANEGTPTTFNFAITDPDAGNTFTFAAGYPDCGNGLLTEAPASPAPSINSTTKVGSFECTFPDGLVPAVDDTVKVKVADSAGGVSTEATTDVTVNNVAPTVTAGTLDLTTVECQTEVTLSGISFSDPGADAAWTGSIDWGDGSTDSTFTAAATGSVDNQTHNYVTPGGPYTATVTVTDKDDEFGSDTSTNTVTVAQTYTVDFLPPFDDSSPSGLIVNKMKNGRVVPVKATIYDDCTESFVKDPTETVTIRTSKTSGTGTGDPVETYADAGQSASNTNLFRWSSDGFWIYNLDSKALGLVVNNLYRVDISVDGVQATDDTWAVLQPVK
jgi:hypothetical protein